MAGKETTDFLKLWIALKDTAEDRTVAIICGAYVEDILAHAIATQLLGANKERREKLFGDKGALGPVAARIEMARALDIIDGDECRLLTQVVRIRNRFAHNIEVETFDHETVAPLIEGEMNLSAGMQKEFSDAYSDSVTQTRRERFVSLALLLCVRLTNRVRRARGEKMAYRIHPGAKDDADNL